MSSKTMMQVATRMIWTCQSFHTKGHFPHETEGNVTIAF